MQYQWRANTFSTNLRLRAHRPGGASVALSSAGVSVGARKRASCSDSPKLFERNGAKRNAASSSARPNPEQRKAVAAGDRHSEAPRPVCPQAQICREVKDSQK
jgi:hypothetical protein